MVGWTRVKQQPENPILTAKNKKHHFFQKGINPLLLCFGDCRPKPKQRDTVFNQSKERRRPSWKFHHDVPLKKNCRKPPSPRKPKGKIRLENGRFKEKIWNAATKPQTLGCNDVGSNMRSIDGGCCFDRWCKTWSSTKNAAWTGGCKRQAHEFSMVLQNVL
mgnify:CR=1 FL=1